MSWQSWYPDRYNTYLCYEKNHLSQHMVGLRMFFPSFTFLDGCQGADMGCSAWTGAPQGESRTIHHPSQKQGSHGVAGQPWGTRTAPAIRHLPQKWDRSLQIDQAHWTPWLGSGKLGPAKKPHHKTTLWCWSRSGISTPQLWFRQGEKAWGWAYT